MEHACGFNLWNMLSCYTVRRTHAGRPAALKLCLKQAGGRSSCNESLCLALPVRMQAAAKQQHKAALGPQVALNPHKRQTYQLAHKDNVSHDTRQFR